MGIMVDEIRYKRDHEDEGHQECRLQIIAQPSGRVDFEIRLSGGRGHVEENVRAYGAAKSAVFWHEILTQAGWTKVHSEPDEDVTEESGDE